ncbi:hypothetical protein [Streptomyces chilikensis]|uniref:Tail assembly chaperone n=1 Tax=Streptomyces chilikensis TaxID=1194079 RepID=A0ABV3EJF7_9ACTN
MAIKKFALNTEPHVAEIGDDLRFEFQPEVDGDEFMEAYEALQESARRVGDITAPDAATRVDMADVREARAATKEFLAGLMLPDSAEEFRRAKLPERIISSLLEWVLEIYGGGAGERPTGSSTASSAASPRAGTRGRAPSRSRG